MFVKRSRIATGLLALGAAGALVVPAPAQAVEVDLHAQMQPTAAHPQARGHAEYESESSHREFEISIAGVRALAGRRLTVRVHGDLVGRMTVGPRGRAHLERHSSVPSTRSGNVVRVRTGSGRLVTFGTFHRDMHD
jgi:hypothetical protein